MGKEKIMVKYSGAGFIFNKIYRIYYRTGSLGVLKYSAITDHSFLFYLSIRLGFIWISIFYGLIG